MAHPPPDRARPARERSTPTRPRWNGRDWYVTFGERTSVRRWEDAEAYGFVSAGGGEWYSATLRSVPVRARVFVCIPKVGYVGVGEVAAPATPFDQAVLEVGGALTPMASLDLAGTYRHQSEQSQGEAAAEWVLPVRWDRVLGREQALWLPGFFANQNSACRFRHDRTRLELTHLLGLDP